MKVAIAGAGKVGRFLAEDLAQGGHEVELLDSNADLVATLPPVDGVRYITADACEVSSLKAAHFDEMDVVVATTGDDEDNLVISQLAKQEFAVPRVHREGQPPEEPLALQRDVGRRRRRVDTAAARGPRRGGRLGRDARPPPAVRWWPHPAHGSDPGEDSPVIGTEFGSIVLPRGSAVVALVREGHVVVPRSDSPLDVGDEVVLLVSAQCEDDEIRSLLLQGT